MEKKIVPDSVVYSDTFGSYNVLENSALKRYRINRSQIGKDPSMASRISGIRQAVFAQIRRRSQVPLPPISWKECEWRLSNSNSESQLLQLNQ
jgi:transposase